MGRILEPHVFTHSCYKNSVGIGAVLLELWSLAHALPWLQKQVCTQGSLVQPCQEGLNSNRGCIPRKCLTLLCRGLHQMPLHGIFCSRLLSLYPSTLAPAKSSLYSKRKHTKHESSQAGMFALCARTNTKREGSKNQCAWLSQADLTDESACMY